MSTRSGSVPQIDWNALYAEELPRVYNFFRYRVGDDAVAEDLTAATFEKAWRARRRFRRDRASFSTWLFTIARNVAIDHYRRRRPTVPIETVELRAEASSPQGASEHDDDLAYLAALLTELAPRERELVALKYGAGLTNRPIARLTSLTESNVGTILHRVVRKLGTEWETSYER